MAPRKQQRQDFDKYRSVQNPLVSYLGLLERDKTEVSMLYELLDERRLNKRATILSSIYSGKELRSYYCVSALKRKKSTSCLTV